MMSTVFLLQLPCKTENFASPDVDAVLHRRRQVGVETGDTLVMTVVVAVALYVTVVVVVDVVMVSLNEI